MASYSHDIKAIDNYLDRLVTSGNADPAQFSDTAAIGIIKEIEGLKTDGGLASKVRQIFLNPPRLSHLPARQISAYLEIRDMFLEGNKEIDRPVTSEKWRWRAIAANAIELLPEEERDQIESVLRLRRDVACAFLKRRKFAKVHALEHAWPELLARIWVEGPPALRRLEKATLETEVDLTEMPRWCEQYVHDENFHRFLKLQPLFQEISDKEFLEIFATSGLVAQSTPAITPGGVAEVTPLPAATSERYALLRVRVTCKDENKKEKDDVLCHVLASDDAGDSREDQIAIPFTEFYRSTVAIRDAYLQPVQPIAQPATRHVGEVSMRVIEPRELLQQVGIRLYECIFGQKRM